GVMTRRGVTLTSTALTSVLAAQAVTAAPAGLAASVTAASLTAIAETGTTLTFLKLMAATKLKAGIVGGIILASVTTPVVLHHQAQAKLRDRDDALRQQAARVTKLQEENEQLSNLIRTRRSQTLPNESSDEVLRLRGELGRLRPTVQE